MSRPAPLSALLAALALAASATPAAAQVPGAELPVDPTAAGIPQSSAISEQYQAIEAEVAEALPTPPAPPAAAPEPVAGTPEPAPPAAATEQYHSETPDVSVTQDQPSNVNVSIRINSPGDDGPVTQINNAGGGTTVEHAAQGPAPAPPRPEPAGRPRSTPSEESSDLPETWEWVWTSACFGGAPQAATAAAVPNWSWRWSCEQDRPSGLPQRVPDASTLAHEVLAAMPVPVAGHPLQAVSPPEPPRARADRSRAAGKARAVAPDVASSGGADRPPVAAPLVAATASVPAAVAEHARHVVRAAAQAQPGPADGSGLLPPPLDDPVGASPNPLSAAASVLLGLWMAVLTTAIVLVLPRLRRRRRSGPVRRLTRGASSRLERPG